ncbi:hypothetical protein BYT27DRAFT_7262709 [Phlegmacium glaucopus]|nr:hypothetical protein BYT27DRAFT_7262709 [Phlegmacium glaucopus]
MPDALEEEEYEDNANNSEKEERSGNHRSEEKKMYDPPVHLFSHIANFDQATTCKFQKTNRHV